jgi:flagellar biosynthesis protein FliR
LFVEKANLVEIAAFQNVDMALQSGMLAMVRPGAALLAAPVFGSTSIPVTLRLVVALALGMPALSASAITLPDAGLVSVPGMLLVIGEILAGLMIGFVLQMAVAATLVAGETISNTMGFGFAMMVDPMSGQMNTSIGQFLTLLATALFLAADGHLLLAQAIADSYGAIPVGNAWPAAESLGMILGFGSAMFRAALSIALPVAFALVIIQMIVGFIGRAAPAFNLMSVGLPATLLFGLILLAFALPTMSDAMAQILDDALALTRTVAGG